jgi:small subunit ribosomal protein S21
MITVRIINNDLPKATKRLKKRMQDEGVYREMKGRVAYRSPSERRRHKDLKAAQRRRKMAKRMG